MANPNLNAVVFRSFTPAELFAGGQEGTWLDPSHFPSLWQDNIKTIRVAAAGDPVSHIVTRSGHRTTAGAPSDAARPTYQTSGGLSLLRFDGTDDGFTGPTWASIATNTQFDCVCAGVCVVATTDSGGEPAYSGDTFFTEAGGGLGLYFRSSGKIVAQNYPEAVEDAYTIGTPFVAHVRLAKGVLSLQINNRPGVSVASTSVNTLAAGMRLARNYNASVCTELDFYGIVFRKTLISERRLIALRRWMAAKVGASW